MILNKLKLTNFKKYTSKEFDFAEGLIGIIGKNGSGKSTIFEAILFALYGELKSKGNKELIRNSSVSDKENVSVELVFEFDGIEYKVIREFRGKALSANAKIYQNAQVTATGAKEVTSYIIKLTKMNKEAFMHTLFASQKELTSLSTLKVEDRKRMIRKLLGLEKIDYIENLLIEKIRELKREINTFAEVLLSKEEMSQKEESINTNTIQKELLAKDIELYNKELESLKNHETHLKAELELLQKTKEQKQKVFSDITVLKSSLSSSKEQLDKLILEQTNLQEKQKELVGLKPLKEEYTALQNSLKEQQNLKEIFLRKQGLIKERDELRKHYMKAKTDINVLESECRGYEDKKLKLDNAQNRINTLNEQIKTLDNVIKKLYADLAGENKIIEQTSQQIQKLQTLGKDANCPVCTRPLLEEYDNVVATLSSTINTIQKEKIDKYTVTIQKDEQDRHNLQMQKQLEEQEVQKLSKEIALIESKQKDLQKAKEYLNSTEERGKKNNHEIEELEKYSYDEKYHQELLTKEKELKDKYDYILRLETVVLRLDTVANEIQNTNKSIDRIAQNIVVKDKEYISIIYDETMHQDKQNIYVQVIESKETLVNIINDLKIKSANIDGEIKILQNILAKNTEYLSKLALKQLDLGDYEKIKVSLAEFKTRLNSKIAPRISAIASDMYARITKGKYQHIEVGDDFDFFIYDEGQRYPIERFSGGEIDLANLVLRIAISKTLSELNGAGNIGFLAFDEVFGSQDESRRMEILEAFHTIKEQYRQIFLISHEMEIKEMFERVVEV